MKGYIMKIEEILAHAEKDLKIDDTELDRESLRIPQLHNKYLVLLTNEKFTLKNLEIEYNKMNRLKWEYYTGKMDQEELKARNWQPFQLRILKQDIDIYMNSDDDLNKIKLNIDYQKEKVNYLESILKGIMNRHWQIRSAIDWRKFTNGVD